MILSLSLALLLFQAGSEPKPATLEGSVTHAASKTAIRKAKVTLTAIGFEGRGSVEAGDDGKFQMKDVKPGRYRLTAEKTGYETTAYGAKSPGDALGQVLRVDGAAALTGLDIGMPKQGVIAGKVTDADNEPVQKALVMALGTVFNNGKRIRIPRGTVPVLTNDLGEYRIGQLPPGRYVVCAVPFSWLQPNPEEKVTKPVQEDGPATTCFPNVGQMNDGTPLEIKDAVELPGIDLRLIRTKMVSVQGRITGVPAGAGTVTILNLNSRTAGPMGNALNPRAFLVGGEGKFEFRNVPPGSYTLHTLPTGLGNTPFVVKAAVEVGDQPLTDLQVPAITPFEVKAKVAAEPGPELKMGSIRLILTPADEIQSTVSLGTANADGDVTLTNVTPGRYKVVVQGQPGTHYVREIRCADQAVAADEVEIPGASTALAVSLAVGKAEITGVARNAKGEPVPGARVGLIPEPRRPFRQKLTVTDQNGAFKLANLAPGEYLVVALESLEPGALEDEENIKPLLSKMKKVRAEDGPVAAFELTVLPGLEK